MGKILGFKNTFEISNTVTVRLHISLESMLRNSY